jgi:hypothetical protein
VGFEGDVKTISLFDLVQTLATSGRTGTLTVRDNEQMRMLFVGNDGLRLLDTSDREMLGVKEIILSESTLPRETVATSLRDAYRQGVQLEDYLLENEIAYPAEYWGWIRNRIEVEILAAFHWSEATYSFVDEEELVAELSPVLTRISFDTTTLLFEAARRLDENREFLALYPPNTATFRLTPRGRTSLREGGLAASRTALLNRIAEGSDYMTMLVETGLGEMRLTSLLKEMMSEGYFNASPGVSRKGDTSRIVRAKKPGISSPRVSFGALAVQMGYVRLEDLTNALQLQSAERAAGRDSEKIGDILTASGALTEKQVRHVLRVQKAGPVHGQIGGYNILSKLGEDIFGVTYRAVDGRTQEPVLIKLFYRMYNRALQQTDSFSTLLADLRSVKHSHLAEIKVVGEFRGMLFLVMNVVQGKTLAKYFADGVIFQQRAALDIFNQLIRVLSTGSHRGYYHLDINPQCIIMSDDGEVKLLNLGLMQTFAEFVEMKPEALPPRDSNFIAPEIQRNPTLISAGADIFSLGVLVYQLLTGRVPPRPFNETAEETGLHHRIFDRIQAMLNPDATVRPSTYSELKRVWEQM